MAVTQQQIDAFNQWALSQGKDPSMLARASGLDLGTYINSVWPQIQAQMQAQPQAPAQAPIQPFYAEAPQEQLFNAPQAVQPSGGYGNMGGYGAQGFKLTDPFNIEGKAQDFLSGLIGGGGSAPSPSAGVNNQTFKGRTSYTPNQNLFSNELINYLISQYGPSAPQVTLQREAPLFNELGQREMGDIEAARQRFMQESNAEQPLFAQAGQQAMGDYGQAANALQAESLGYLPMAMQQYQQVFQPQYEENLRQGRMALGGRGLGAGGFDSSGALQELAAREATKLQSQVLGQALPYAFQGLQGASQLRAEGALQPSQYRQQGLNRNLANRDIFGQYGLQGALAPAEARRGLFDRTLEGYDTDVDWSKQKVLADKGAEIQYSAAREARKGQERAALYQGIGSLLGGAMKIPGLFG